MNFKTKKTLYIMYDKRYSNAEIKRIRQWASTSMFFVMLLLCIGVGKVAYWIGHQNGYVEGYNDRMNDDVVNPVSSFVPAPATYEVQKASFEPQSEVVYHHPQSSLISAQVCAIAAFCVAIWCGYGYFSAPRPKKGLYLRNRRNA